MSRSFRLEKPNCPECGQPMRIIRTPTNAVRIVLSVILALILTTPDLVRCFCPNCDHRSTGS